MHDDLPWDDLDRYFSGLSSREDAAAVSQRTASDAEYRRELALVRCVWEAGAGGQAFDTNAAWRRVAPQIGRTARIRPTPPFAPLLRARRRWSVVGAMVAAAMLVAVASGIIAGERWGVARRAAIDAAPAREYATGSGQRMAVLLSDGTRVDLNVASRLRVPRGYGVNTRDVALEGEAFFDVHHDVTHPFRVRAGSLVAEDVGTTFVVRAYAGDSAATVAVASGQVAMRSVRIRAAAVPVRAGRVGRLEPTGDIAVLDHADVSRYMGWRDGRLEFRDTPVPAVARELERWYGVQVSLADSSLASASLTASFTNEPLENVLHDIARLLGARYTRQGTHIRLYTSGRRS